MTTQTAVTPHLETVLRSVLQSVPSTRVLVVVVLYNSREYIAECFSSLTVSTQPFDLLVIDNASTDGAADSVKEFAPNAEVISLTKNLGFAGGNNIGIDRAIAENYDFVYLLNHDTVVEPDFLSRAITLAKTNDRIGAVQSKLLLYQDKKHINSIGNEIHYLGFAYAGGYQLPDEPLEPREVTYPSGAATLYRVSALREVGNFNPEFFMYHEDTDLGWRLWLAGWRCMLAPTSVVYHKYEFSRSISKYYYMERNRLWLLLSNYKLATLLVISPALFFMNTLLLGYSFIGGFWREEWRAYAFFLKPQSWQAVKRSRQHIARIRRVKDHDVVKRFTGIIVFQDVQNPLLRYIVNPLTQGYWEVVRRFIWW